MSRSTIALAAGALWLAAWPAAAEPFRSYEDLCLATNANQQAAVAKAKSAGWFALPAEAMGETDEEFQDMETYLSVDPATMTNKAPSPDIEILITGWGSGEDVFGISGVQLDVCIVMTMSETAEALKAGMQARLNIPPFLRDGVEGWIFSRQGSGFRSEAALLESPEEDLPRLVQEHKFFVASVISAAGMNGLILGAFRPEE